MAARRAAQCTLDSLPTKRPLFLGRYPNHGPELLIAGGCLGFIWGDRRSWEVSVVLIDYAWAWKFWSTWTDITGVEVSYTSCDSFEKSKAHFSQAIRRIHRAFDSAVNGARRGRAKHPRG